MKKLLLVFFLTIAQSAYSANLTEVNIYGEKISDCSLTNASVSAALAGTMRYNRVNVTEKISDIGLYHRVTSVKINGGCAVSVQLEFQVFENILVKNLNKKIMTNAVLCGKNELLAGPIYDMQTRVNNSASDMAQQCLLEISKK
jgi:hypothetical protein